jgi:GNAT superfamily N-acetyltransferase
MPMEIRVATLEDWELLSCFFRRIYRTSHPLQNQDFWIWRFGESEFGASIVAINEGQIVGHVGVNRSSEIAWIINVFLDQDWRGKGLLAQMYSLAAEFGLPAATNVNDAGVGMYRKMGWIELDNLRRFVFRDKSTPSSALLLPVERQEKFPQPQQHHYWRQPGIVGIADQSGSTAVDFLIRGGLRMVEIVDPRCIEDFILNSGAKWADYVTSRNDPICEELESLGWKTDYEQNVPWLFNPIDQDSRMNINVFARNELPANLIIRRWDSDHGRVGSV